MINSLIAKVTCTEDEICNYCIEVLEVMSKNLGITYGQLNVYLLNFRKLREVKKLKELRS